MANESGPEVSGVVRFSLYVVVGLFGFLTILSLIGGVYSILLGGKPVPQIRSPQLEHRAEQVGGFLGSIFMWLLLILVWGMGGVLGLQVLASYLLLTAGTIDLVLYPFGIHMFVKPPDHDLPWQNFFCAGALCSAAFFTWREVRNKNEPVTRDWPPAARVLAVAVRILFFSLVTTAILLAFGLIGLVLVWEAFH